MLKMMTAARVLKQFTIQCNHNAAIHVMPLLFAACQQICTALVTSYAGGRRRKLGYLVVALLPALLSQADLGLIHNHDVKHVSLLLCHCLHLVLHNSNEPSSTRSTVME